MAENAPPAQPAAAALLERETELSELGELVVAAAEGRGAAAAVLGPAGIGKTSLLRAVSSLANERGLAVLAARGGELERDFAYGVIRQLLERPLHELPADERQAVLNGAAGLAAPVLGLARADAQGGSDAPFAVVHALYWVCANLAGRRPLLVAVDDAHWADAASLRALAYLSRRVEELPLLLVSAARPAREDDRAELVHAITMAPEVRTVRPSPLSKAAVAEVVAASLKRRPEPELAHACWEATGGNPFLCEALASTLAEQAPDASGAEVVVLAGEAVSTLVIARLGRLPGHAMALARAVAILGTNADLRRVAALAELDERAAATAADALAAQGILSVGRPLEFVHPLVRAAVAEQVPAAERLFAHARAARLVDAAGAPADSVAVHLLAAEPSADVWAVERLVAAARSGMGRGAPETAVTCLRRALREPPAPADRAAVLHELGAAELVLGEPGSAAEHLGEARELTEDPASRAGIARDLAAALSIAGRYEAAVEVLDETLARLPEAGQELILGLEGQRFAHAAMAPRDPGAPIPRSGPKEFDPAGRTRGERAYLAALATGALFYLDRPECLEEWARRAIDGGIVGELTARGAIWHPLAYALAFADRFELLGRMVDDGLEESRRQGSALGAARAYQSRAMLQLRVGQLREAAADARIAIDTGAEVGLVGRVVAVDVLIQALVERGDLEAADAALREAGLDGEIALHFFGNFALHGRGWLRLAQGRRADAIADFEELERRGERWHPWNPGMFPYRSGLALALLADGDRGRARRLAQEELERSRRWGARRAIGISSARWGSARAASEGWHICARASTRWRAPARGSSTPTRWSSWGPRSAAPASARMPVSRCTPAWSSPTAAAPSRWWSAPARSSAPPAPARDASFAPAWTR